MRVEEKQVDGLELERRQDLEHTPLEREAAEEEAEVGEEGVTEVEQARSAELVATMRLILKGDHEVDLARMGLPAREHAALEALHAAVTGKRPTLDTFVFAEDRLGLLEQALAVLQPMLVAGDEVTAEILTHDFERLTGRVQELRSCLIGLEDAQDDLFVEHARMAAAREATPGATDTDAKPAPGAKPTPKPGAKPTGADATSGSLLTDGPEVAHPASVSSLSDGPEATRAPHRSTLAEGTAANVDPPPSTLGDAKEIAQAQQQLPWWRRPVG